MFPNWAKNILFLLVYMISGLVLVIIIDGLTSGTDLIPLNLAVEGMVMHVRTPVLTTLLVWVTRIGNPFILSFVASFIALLMFVRGRFYDAVLFLVAMALAIISLVVLKDTFQITRPGYGIVDETGWSFPSGHATVATAFFFALSHAFVGKIKSAWNRASLIIGSIVIAFLICFSRLYLGAHWTLDILAGIALGLLSVSFTVLMFNIFLDHRRSLRKSMNL